MNGANPCRNWHNPRVVKRVLLHARNFFTWSESCFTPPFDPNVLSRDNRCRFDDKVPKICLDTWLNLSYINGATKKCIYSKLNNGINASVYYKNSISLFKKNL